MSNSQYFGYLGSKKCCDSKIPGYTGPAGPDGLTGPRGILGFQGQQGTIGYTGAWCTGPTGPGIGKSFIINHPLNDNKYLIHECVEGPEIGVYYRGSAVIEDNECVTIRLPNYVEKIATEFTIEITPIRSSLQSTSQNIYETTEILNNCFNVYGKNGKFYWTVYGKKNEIVIEPNKNDVDVRGNGPYKWYI